MKKFMALNVLTGKAVYYGSMEEVLEGCAGITEVYTVPEGRFLLIFYGPIKWGRFVIPQII